MTLVEQLNRRTARKQTVAALDKDTTRPDPGLDLDQIARDIENPRIGWSVLASHLPQFDLPVWIDRMEFAKAFLKTGIKMPLKRSHTYRVYALFGTYVQTIGDDTVTFKTFKGVDIQPVEQLYHGGGRVKVGEMTL